VPTSCLYEEYAQTDMHVVQTVTVYNFWTII